MGIEKNVLEQYSSIVEEIADLERRNRNDRNEIKKLEKQIMSDTVTGSRDDLTIGPIMVKGVAEGLADKKRDQIEARIMKQNRFRKRLLNMKQEIEDYIQKIEDSEIRRIARFRYIDDLEWRQVAVRMGRGYTDTACRKKMERFLQKNKSVRS
ncbi:MAG: hypothetical protein J6B94_08545 [Lachnospiraceae bacterium]|nr:hypothetical protein [Lachnospiraceae bacterium]